MQLSRWLDHPEVPAGMQVLPGAHQGEAGHVLHVQVDVPRVVQEQGPAGQEAAIHPRTRVGTRASTCTSFFLFKLIYIKCPHRSVFSFNIQNSEATHNTRSKYSHFKVWVAKNAILWATYHFAASLEALLLSYYRVNTYKKWKNRENLSLPLSLCQIYNWISLWYK